MSYYHCSPVALQTGEVVIPRFDCHVMFMSDNPAPHYTIAEFCWEEGWYVYEVHPLGEVLYGTKYKELMAASAVVVQCLGKALDLFPEKNTSKVEAQDHPVLKQVWMGRMAWCENPVDFLVTQAFDLYECYKRGEDGCQWYYEYLDYAINFLEAEPEKISPFVLGEIFKCPPYN